METKIEHFINTTNPMQNSSFQSFTSYGKNDELNSEILHIFQCTLNPGDYDKTTKQYEKLKQEMRNEWKKVGEKRGIFGKVKDEMGWVPYVFKNEIKIIQESNSGKVKPDDYDADFRDCQEKAPYKIVKTKLRDGRVLVARAAYIGKVYGDGVDVRTGNIFQEAFILPEGMDLTDEQIKQLKFQISLDYKAILAGKIAMIPKNLPKLDEKDILNRQLTKKDFKQVFSVAEKILEFQNEEELLRKKIVLSKQEGDRLDNLHNIIETYEDKLAGEMAKVNPQDVLTLVEQEKKELEDRIKKMCENKKQVYTRENFFNDDEYKILKIIEKQARYDLKDLQNNTNAVTE